MGMNVSEMTSEYISEMTENFLKSGGTIEKFYEDLVSSFHVSSVFDDWMGVDKYFELEKGKGCHNWTEEHDMRVNCKSFYRLCPYNAFVVENG